MILKDILDMKPGTLIKGITQGFDKGQPYGSYMNKEGWSIGPEVPVIKTHSAERWAALTYVPDDLMKKVENTLVPTKGIGDLTTTTLLVNSRILKTIFLHKADFNPLFEGRILGMSLGTSVVSFMPEAPQIYRQNNASLICYHKVLMKDKVNWVRLISRKRVSFYNETSIKESAKSIMMEIS